MQEIIKAEWPGIPEPEHAQTLDRAELQQRSSIQLLTLAQIKLTQCGKFGERADGLSIRARSCQVQHFGEARHQSIQNPVNPFAINLRLISRAALMVWLFQFERSPLLANQFACHVAGNSCHLGVYLGACGIESVNPLHRASKGDLQRIFGERGVMQGAFDRAKQGNVRELPQTLPSVALAVYAAAFEIQPFIFFAHLALKGVRSALAKGRMKIWEFGLTGEFSQVFAQESMSHQQIHPI